MNPTFVFMKTKVTVEIAMNFLVCHCFSAVMLLYFHTSNLVVIKEKALQLRTPYSRVHVIILSTEVHLITNQLQHEILVNMNVRF